MGIVPPIFITLHQWLWGHVSCIIANAKIITVRLFNMFENLTAINDLLEVCSWWHHCGTISSSYSPWLGDVSSMNCPSLPSDQCSLIVPRWYHYGATSRPCSRPLVVSYEEYWWPLAITAESWYDRGATNGELWWSVHHWWPTFRWSHDNSL